MRVGKFMWTLCWYSTRINCSLLSLLNYLPFHCSWHWYIYVYIYIYMKNVKVLAAQLCLTICSPMDCSPLGSSVHGIQLEWVAMPFSKGSSQPRNRTQVSCIAGKFFTDWAMREALVSSTKHQKPLTVWIIINYGKLLKRWEYQTISSVSWETCMWVTKQQLEACMEQLIVSRLRKEYDRAVCHHPVCLT